MRVLTGLLVALYLCVSLSAEAAPRHVYVTWGESDTSTTMQVMFHSMEGAKKGVVQYGKLPQHRLDLSQVRHLKMFETEGKSVDGLADGRTIHTANLTGLKPGATYYFIAGTEEDGYSEALQFRTIKKRAKQIRFITGGDMGVEHNVVALLEQAGRQDPDFAAIGGDIAYGNGKMSAVDQWDTWLDHWTQAMRVGNRLIPIVAAIGNHETNDILNNPRGTAPFYTYYFEQAGEDTHFLRTFGKEMSMLALDTGHVETHASQVDWLTETLAAQKRKQYTFAIYHIPLYPSVRAYEGEWSKRGRDHWAPIFDKYGLTGAFENHDHALKLTKQLRDGKVHPHGTLYFGDGCFGRPPRDVEKDLRWYQVLSKSQSHFWLVEVGKQGAVYTAIGDKGETLYRLGKVE